MKKAFIIFHVVLVHMTHAQDVIPPSPTMSALGKFIEHPVNTYTGTPQIDVPLYTIRTDNFELPIELNYHARGIKVQETASWVGLGWSLRAGGSITRSVRGLPDDVYQSGPVNIRGSAEKEDCINMEEAGYLYSGKRINDLYHETNHEQQWVEDLMKELGTGARDGQPDVFYFSFGPYSGKFLFDQNGQIQIISDDELKITATRPGNREITGFIVTDRSGTSYYFNEVERTKSAFASQDNMNPDQGIVVYNPYTAVEDLTPSSQVASDWEDYESRFSGVFLGAYGWKRPLDRCERAKWEYEPKFKQFNSSWHLSRIVLPSHQEITFTYREEQVHSLNYTGEQLLMAWAEEDDFIPFFTRSANGSWVKVKRIEKISWPEGWAYFRACESDQRKDLDQFFQIGREDYPDLEQFKRNYALSQVEIYNYKNEFVKGYDFSYSYFESEKPDFPESTRYVEGSELDLWQDDYHRNLENVMSKRLKLDQVQEFQRDKEAARPDVSERGLWVSHETPAHTLPPFRFDYANIVLPNRVSTEQDFWGYYNGNGSTTLIPVIYEYPDEHVDHQTFHPSRFSIYPRDSYSGRENVWNEYGVDRNANSSTIQAGMLKRITFPTAGVRSFEYEMHKFNIGERSIAGGGLRIKRITSNAGTLSKNVVTEYDYHDSGQVPDLPLHAGRTNRGVVIDGVWSSALGTTKGSYVAYSKVSIKRPNNGREEYNYQVPAMYGTTQEGLFERPEIHRKYYVHCMAYTTEYIDHSGNSFSIPHMYCSKLEEEDNIDFYPLPTPPNYDWYRGRLDHILTLDVNEKKQKKVVVSHAIKKSKKIPNVQVKVVRSDLTGIPGLGINTVFRGNRSLHYVKSYDIVPWVVQDAKDEYLYDSDNELNAVHSNTRYRYDSEDHRQLTTETSTLSNGDVMSTEYKYTSDFEGDMASRSMAFVSHMILPVETISKVNGQVVSGRINQFKCLDCETEDGFFIDGRFVRDQVHGLDIAAPVSDYHITNGSLTAIDSRYDSKVRFTKYDTYGNIVELENVISGTKTSFIWSYLWNYPVAKVVNASRDEIFDILGTSAFGLINPTDDEVRNILRPLRDQLPNALISIYTYKPLVGMTSETDPAGKTTYYEYDDFNRLKTIKNQGEKVLEQYEYHYKGE